MGLNRAKVNSALLCDNDFPNKNLLYISYDTFIPEVHRGTYFEVRFDKFGNVVCNDKSNLIPDPSTIYVYLPVSDDYKVNPLPYWPHFITLSSGQRYKYLCWLRNVEEIIDIGYVFLYYYGLEKHLLLDNFDEAFDEIIKLRNVHKNKSFLSYSENALIYGALCRGRIDRLVDLHEKTDITGYSNALFLFAYNEGLDLGAEQLSLIFYKAFTLSRKNIKENRSLFIECINKALYTNYGTDYFSIKDYDISNVKTKLETRFANYSFSSELQKINITDFYQCRNLMTDLEVIFKASHEFFKSKKLSLRTGKTHEEIAIAAAKKNETRYRKLLREKKITDSEYALLIRNNLLTIKQIE